MSVNILVSVSKADTPKRIQAIESYKKAIITNGGNPTVAYSPKVDLSYDGLLLAGGSDVHPSYYGQQINGAINIDTQRDKAEEELFKAYFKADKPIFGICRGFQFINVLLGGSLIQHVDCAKNHTEGVFHITTALKGGYIERLFGEKIITNSYHHQAILKLADDLTAVAWSENDKIIEAFEHKNLPIFGVQWHPERMVETAIEFNNAKSNGAINAEKIFKQFIEISKQLKG